MYILHFLGHTLRIAKLSQCRCNPSYAVRCWSVLVVSRCYRNGEVVLDFNCVMTNQLRRLRRQCCQLLSSTNEFDSAIFARPKRRMAVVCFSCRARSLLYKVNFAILLNSLDALLRCFRAVGYNCCAGSVLNGAPLWLLAGISKIHSHKALSEIEFPKANASAPGQQYNVELQMYHLHWCNSNIQNVLARIETTYRIRLTTDIQWLANIQMKYSLMMVLLTY